MIARLTGTVVEARPDRVVLDVGGVGYDVAVPLSTYTALPPAGGRAALHVHTHVREDALSLFGFATESEKRLFERLLTVSGIGPRVALAILSGLPVSELVSAIARQDVRRLSSIPGIGKKLAERIGVELKEKMADFARGAGSGTTGGGPLADAVTALVNLGYREQEASAAAEAAAKNVGTEDLGALISSALKSLAR